VEFFNIQRGWEGGGDLPILLASNTPQKYLKNLDLKHPTPPQKYLKNLDLAPNIKKIWI